MELLKQPGAGTSPVIAVRCNWCSRQKAPSSVHQLNSNQVICDNCLEWHFHALDFLGGAVPKGCQECETAWEVLRAATDQASVRMFVVPKDGIQQLLCEACVLPYARKRLDLYSKTRFEKTHLKAA